MKFSSQLCQVDPGKTLTDLVHPHVFSKIELSLPLPAPEKLETDEVLTLTYRGIKGNIVFRSDGIRILIEATYGSQYILRAALRDRRLDGSEVVSALTFFPNVDKACNRLPAPDFLCAELSIYSWDPDTYLRDLDLPNTVANFIADPDKYVWSQFDPDVFFPLWIEAFNSGRGPWQGATPMTGVATYFVKHSAMFLKELGYHRIDAVPSWFNVARFFARVSHNFLPEGKRNYQFTYGEHQAAYECIEQGLAAFPSLDSWQQSWLVALQNLPECYVPEELKLPARWPVTHTNSYWVRMHLELNEYQGMATKHQTSLGTIAGLRKAPHCPSVRPVLHTAASCPCTNSVGASSPAATGPSATAPVDTHPVTPNESMPAPLPDGTPHAVNPGVSSPTSDPSVSSPAPDPSVGPPASGTVSPPVDPASDSKP